MNGQALERGSVMVQLREKPEMVFQLSATLPSGTLMTGTIGPMIGRQVITEIKLHTRVLNQADLKMANAIVEEALGRGHSFQRLCRTVGDRNKALAELRARMGGGMG